MKSEGRGGGDRHPRRASPPHPRDHAAGPRRRQRRGPAGTTWCFGSSIP